MYIAITKFMLIYGHQLFDVTDNLQNQSVNQFTVPGSAVYWLDSLAESILLLVVTWQYYSFEVWCYYRKYKQKKKNS